MKPVPTICLQFLGGLVLCMGNALGTDRYVSTSGLDTNPGTLAQPWRTIQKAATVATAGDTVFIRGNGGVYSERIVISGRDGNAGSPIVFKTYPGDPMAVVETTIAAAETGTIALLTIENSDHVSIQNLEFRNCKTTGNNTQQKAKLPIGIQVRGDGAGVSIRGCRVHDIWQSCTQVTFDANGFGIAVYGDSATPIDGLILDGNEVYNLRTGASESVAINGNVTNFSVTNNTVHDCNNIGIDFIGFEGTNANVALDQARFGLCAGNVVYNIDSKFNPAYGGNFTTGGNNGTRSAPGLYVDGGRDIVMERNHVYLCNFAVSVASEWQGKVASNVIVRNNLFHHCHVGGIVMGGAGATNGGTSNCTFTHNTLVENDTTGFGGGQISIQENVTGTIIQRNLMATPATFAQFVLKTSTSGSFAPGAIDWNAYRNPSGGSVEFYWNGVAYSSVATWKAAAGLAKDEHSFFTTANLGLVNNTPTSASPPGDFALVATSPVRDIGDSAALPFVAASGERDFFGNHRVLNTRVDIGAHEYISFAIWSQETTGGALTFTTDADEDGTRNGVEYATVNNPSAPNSNPLRPPVLVTGPAWQFTLPWRPGATDLRYVFRRSDDLLVWSDLYRYDLSTGAVTLTGATVAENISTRTITLTVPDAATHRFWRMEVERVP